MLKYISSFNLQIEIPDASRVEDSAKSRSAFREDLFSDDKEETRSPFNINSFS